MKPAFTPKRPRGEKLISTISLIDSAGSIRPLKEIRKDALALALAHHGDNFSAACSALRISRATAYRMMAQS
jgi:transcriptional regulator with PAS, ATPase and Fis domain